MIMVYPLNVVGDVCLMMAAAGLKNLKYAPWLLTQVTSTITNQNNNSRYYYMKHNIDILKIHTLTTQVDHKSYMAYRAAIKSTHMTSASFLRCLVTIGLNEVTPIVSKRQPQTQLKKQMPASQLKKQMDALQAKMDALIGIKGAPVSLQTASSAFYRNSCPVS